MMQKQNTKSFFDIKKKFPQDEMLFEDFLAALTGFEDLRSNSCPPGSIELFVSESLLRKANNEGIPLYLEFEIAVSYGVKKNIDSFIYHNPQKDPSEIKPHKIGLYAKIGVGHFCTLLDEVQEGFLAFDPSHTSDCVKISQYISHVGCNFYIYPQYLQHQHALNYMPASSDYYVYSIGIELYPQYFPFQNDCEIFR